MKPLLTKEGHVFDWKELDGKFLHIRATKEKSYDGEQETTLVTGYETTSGHFYILYVETRDLK